MNKLILILLSLSVGLFARYDAYPNKECSAFNNMKHTKNTNSVLLDKNKKYTVLKKHKGQHLIIVAGEQPSQRWVDSECFSSKKAKEIPKSIKTEDTKEFKDIGTKKEISRNNLLALSWHNAFCQTHQYKKECKRTLIPFGKSRNYDKHLVLHGLWPQPRDNIYCGVSKNNIMTDKHKQWNRLPKLGLSSDVKKKLTNIMPGLGSNLHKHEWYKHGTCYGADANSYYTDAISLVEQINSSKVGIFFNKNTGKRVTLEQVRVTFNRSFGMGAGKRVELRCKDGLITELWLHLGSGSDDLGALLKKGKEVRSRCKRGYLDKAGF